MEHLQARSFSFREIRTVPEVINAAFDFVRLNFRVLVRGVLLYVAPLMLVGYFLFEYIFSGSRMLSLLGTFSSQPMIGNVASINIAESVLLILLAMLLLLAGFMLLMAYTLGAVKAFMRGDDSTLELGDIWQEVRLLFWKVVGTNILLLLALSTGLLVLSVAIALLSMVFFGLGLLAYVGTLVLLVFFCDAL